MIMTGDDISTRKKQRATAVQPQPLDRAGERQSKLDLIKGSFLSRSSD